MTSLTDTQVVTASGGLVELGSATVTSNVNITATTTGTATEVVAPLTVVCDGGPVLVEFNAPSAYPHTASGGQLCIGLYQDGVKIHEFWGFMQTPAAAAMRAPVSLKYRVTPTSGSHTFGVKAYGSGNAGVIEGANSSTSFSPMILRVSKIVQATQWPAVTTGTIICTSSTRPASPFEGQQIYETGNNRQLVWDGSAWVSPSVTHKPPMCKVTGVTSVPDASDTTCSFTTEVFDTDGMFAPTSTDVTVQTAGVYLFTAECLIGGTANIRGDCYIQKNGSGWLARTTLYGTVERFPVTVTDSASVGDVYTVRVYQDNSSNTAKNCTVNFTALWQGQAS